MIGQIKIKEQRKEYCDTVNGIGIVMLVRVNVNVFYFNFIDIYLMIKNIIRKEKNDYIRVKRLVFLVIERYICI